MLSCSALLSLDSSRDIVIESQLSPSASLPRVAVALPRSPLRLELSPSSSSQLCSPSEESQTARKLILRKRATSPLQVKLPFMSDRLRVRRGKPASPPSSPTAGTQSGTLPSSPAAEQPDSIRTPYPPDFEPTTTPEGSTGPPSDGQSTPCGSEDPGTPCNMLPVRRVRFVTPPSSPEELTAASSSSHGSESTPDDEPIDCNNVSPIDQLPLATFPDAFPWPTLLDDQSAGGHLAVTPQASDGNALGLFVGPSHSEHTVAVHPGLYVLPTVDTWEEICENLSCALEVCAVLAELDRSSLGSMSADYYEPELCSAMHYAHGSGGLWNCRVFPSMLF
ncbi:hypothetical protein C8T65DRAFT_674187 [Cerioporus squamosus]|nr:hypothetical protein C8T65DRAFT_674187 [Cerioporus squamosus]